MKKKFQSGREFIYTDVFPWLSSETPLELIAILTTSSKKELCGGKVVSIDEFIAKIRNEIKNEGLMRRKAIPEEFDLLRTIQLVINGYNKKVK